MSISDYSPQIILAAVVVPVAVAYMFFIAWRSGRRNAAGRCGRCGCVLEGSSEEVQVTEDESRFVCATCAKKIQRGYRNAAYFIGFLVVFVVAGFGYILLKK